MSQAIPSEPIVKGWCPGALRPMASGDGLVARLRAPLGRLSPDQVAGVAELSLRLGNGLIDLSARANLQIRGIRECSHEELLDGLAALDLLDTNPLAEARRNIALTPFWDAGDDSQRLANALDATLRNEGAPQTPGKFGYGVDCGFLPVLREASADIRFERSENGLICRPDGAMTGARVSHDSACDAALELARWFLETGGAPTGRGRMARHLAKGIALPERFTEATALPHAAQAPAPGMSPQGRLIALEFGQIRAEHLAQLGQIAPLRLTPWRMLLLEGSDARPELPALIHDAADPRLRVEVCTGADGCTQALSHTRDLARELAPELDPDQHLHISGCAKGCAHPGSSDITLTATDEGRFDLIRNGRASDTPEKRDLTSKNAAKAI